MYDKKSCHVDIVDSKVHISWLGSSIVGFRCFCLRLATVMVFLYKGEIYIADVLLDIFYFMLY